MISDVKRVRDVISFVLNLKYDTVGIFSITLVPEGLHAAKVYTYTRMARQTKVQVQH